MIDKLNKFELEKEWRSSLQKFTDKDLLEVFPEAKKVIPSKIKEWELIKNRLGKKIGDSLSSIYLLEANDFSEWFGEEVIRQYYFPELEESEKNMTRLKRLEIMISSKNKYVNNFQEKLERARNYPIKDIAQQKLDLRPSGSNFVALCPFHNEKTPSFYLYANSDSFHCFGCQEHGDVIKLTMQLHGVCFSDAIKLLN